MLLLGAVLLFFFVSFEDFCSFGKRGGSPFLPCLPFANPPLLLSVFLFSSIPFLSMSSRRRQERLSSVLYTFLLSNVSADL